MPACRDSEVPPLFHDDSFWADIDPRGTRQARGLREEPAAVSRCTPGPSGSGGPARLAPAWSLTPVPDSFRRYERRCPSRGAHGHLRGGQSVLYL